VADEPLDGQPIGWRVIDPDGNVVASGPPISLEMATFMGDGQDEEAVDGSD
jgi:hypothetical protein